MAPEAHNAHTVGGGDNGRDVWLAQEQSMWLSAFRKMIRTPSTAATGGTVERDPPSCTAIAPPGTRDIQHGTDSDPADLEVRKRRALKRRLLLERQRLHHMAENLKATKQEAVQLAQRREHDRNKLANRSSLLNRSHKSSQGIPNGM